MRFGARAAAASGDEAKARRDEQHTVHSVLVELASARAGSADDLSDVIERVEAAGWCLDRVENATLTAHARPMVLLIFRAV